MLAWLRTLVSRGSGITLGQTLRVSNFALIKLLGIGASLWFKKGSYGEADCVLHSG